MKAIEQWDDNIKLVLDNFARLNDKIMLSRTNGEVKDDLPQDENHLS